MASASDDGVVLSSTDTQAGVEANAENHPVGETPTPLLRKEGSYKVIGESEDLHDAKKLVEEGERYVRASALRPYYVRPVHYALTPCGLLHVRASAKKPGRYRSRF